LAHGLGITNVDAEKIKRNIATLKEGDQKIVRDLIALTLDGILSETDNFVRSYEHRSGHAIEKIILTGGGVALEGFIGMVQAKFKGEVKVGNSFSKVDTPAVLAETLKSSGLEFAVAVGIALRKIQELD
jgi:Tfp pilus assembly PilM family ATPase